MYKLFKEHENIYKDFKESLPRRGLYERNWIIWECFMGINVKNKSMKEICHDFNITSERVKQIFSRFQRNSKKFIFQLDEKMQNSKQNTPVFNNSFS